MDAISEMTPTERDAILVGDVLPALSRLAGSRWRACSRFDVEDLVSAGMLAAIRALDRWTPDGEASPAAYARIRGLGAMTDYVRRETDYNRGTESARITLSLDAPLKF
jgi:DNA-directed RNA polymerase specialized sigma subunit